MGKEELEGSSLQHAWLGRGKTLDVSPTMKVQERLEDTKQTGGKYVNGSDWSGATDCGLDWIGLD
jgi:hypothetical protein